MRSWTGVEYHHARMSSASQFQTASPFLFNSALRQDAFCTYPTCAQFDSPRPQGRAYSAAAQRMGKSCSTTSSPRLKVNANQVHTCIAEVFSNTICPTRPRCPKHVLDLLYVHLRVVHVARNRTNWLRDLAYVRIVLIWLLQNTKACVLGSQHMFGTHSA